MKRKIIAIITVAVVVVMVLAGLVATYPGPQPDNAQRILLQAGDLGQTGWIQLEAQFPSYTAMNQSITGWGRFVNGTLDVGNSLCVFNSLQDARYCYNVYSSTYLGDGQNITGTASVGDAVTIVNRSFSLNGYSYASFEVVFLRGDVVAFLETRYSVQIPSQLGNATIVPSWQYDSTVLLAHLQAYKIDVNRAG